MTWSNMPRGHAVVALMLLLAANGQTTEKEFMSKLRFAISFTAEKSQTSTAACC